jgi:hypothetical protein
METLVKKIEERMHGEWSMIREEDLERIWPINEEDREEKICYANMLCKMGFRSVYEGNGWGGIRTPGAFRHTRFPGVHNQPLCHPSRTIFLFL